MSDSGPSGQIRLDELLTKAVKDSVAEQLVPVRLLWDQRSQDMLEVLADAAEARAQVRAAARTIRLAGWLGLLAMVLGAVSVWVVLEHERVERRAARQFDQGSRDAAVAEVIGRVERVCGRR